MYHDQSPYHTPRLPDLYQTPTQGNMLPPPPPPKFDRARSVIYDSIEGRGSHTPASSVTPDSEGSLPPRRQRTDTGIPRGEIGKRLSPREDLILIETCNENTFSYGLKDKVTEWWKKIEKDFQAVVNRPIPYKFVRRRIESLVEQRKKEIADYQTGDERKEHNWTHAIDAWIETVEIYNLEQENSLRENSVVKTKRAISIMKRTNMLKIHSKPKGIEDFYEDIEGLEDGGELKETDAALEPDYQSSPNVQERNFLDDDEDLSDGDIRPTKRAKVAMVNVSRPDSATPIQEEDALQPSVS